MGLSDDRYIDCFDGKLKALIVQATVRLIHMSCDPRQELTASRKSRTTSTTHAVVPLIDGLTFRMWYRPCKLASIDETTPNDQLIVLGYGWQIGPLIISPTQTQD
jgi:hypothetical protein